MSDLTDRIAEVLRGHELNGKPCICCANIDAAHVAERIVAELQRETHMEEEQHQIERIRALAETWAVDDDTYLHLDGQDLGYADAAVQIFAILEVARDS